MANQTLLDYIRQNLDQGIDREQIFRALIDAGWSEAEVRGSLEETTVLSTPVSSPSPVVPQEKKGLLSAPQILGQAWSVYRQKIGVLLGVTLLMIILPAISVLLNLLFSKSPSGWYVIVSPLVSLLGLFAQAWGYLSFFVIIRDRQEKVSVFEAYRRTVKKLPAYLWLMILSYFVLIGGFMLLFIPALVLGVSLALAVPIFVTENLRGITVIQKSRVYVKGFWVKVAWRQAFLGCFFMLIILLPVVASFFFDKSPFFIMVTMVFMTVMSFLSASFGAVYTYVLYENLRQARGEVYIGKKIGFVSLALFGFLALLAIVVGIFFLNPTQKISETRSVEMNDRMREIGIDQIQGYLDVYYRDHGAYPDELVSLRDIYEKMILPIPRDPGTGELYDYYSLGDHQDYRLCVRFEIEGYTCYTAKNYSRFSD